MDSLTSQWSEESFAVFAFSRKWCPNRHDSPPKLLDATVGYSTGAGHVGSGGGLGGVAAWRDNMLQQILNTSICQARTFPSCPRRISWKNWMLMASLIWLVCKRSLHQHPSTRKNPDFRPWVFVCLTPLPGQRRVLRGMEVAQSRSSFG